MIVIILIILNNNLTTIFLLNTINMSCCFFFETKQHFVSESLLVLRYSQLLFLFTSVFEFVSY